MVKDYQGSLSDYAECLVEQEADTGAPSADGDAKKASYKEDKAKRVERTNSIRKMQREMGKIESAIEKLKAKADNLQKEMDDSADEGWTVLADLTEQLQKVNDEIDEKELRWLEVAESLEALEEEAALAA